MTHRLTIALLVAMASLSACGDEPAVAPKGDDSRTAEGEVLGGTISDEMLPLDRVRSQAPALSEEGEASSETDPEE